MMHGYCKPGCTTSLVGYWYYKICIVWWNGGIIVENRANWMSGRQSTFGNHVFANCCLCMGEIPLIGFWDVVFTRFSCHCLLWSWPFDPKI